MSTPYLPFTDSIKHHNDSRLTAFYLHTRQSHTLNSLSYLITMFYNSIILALTAMQVLAQDQYTPDAPSDYGTTIEGTSFDPSPTAAPYVPIQSDGTPSNDGASNNNTNGTDPSAPAGSYVSVNGDSAVSSAPTSNYTSNYSTAYSTGYSTGYTSPAASDASSQSQYSSTPSSYPAWVEPPAPSVPPSNPPVYLHIKFEKDKNKCLAIFDTSHQDNTPVK
jgi:hypothetical protein